MFSRSNYLLNDPLKGYRGAGGVGGAGGAMRSSSSIIHHPGDGSKQSPAVRRRKEEPSVEGGEGEEIKG